MISAVPAFSDNYIWIIGPDNPSQSKQANPPKVAVVDPGDAQPVIRFLEEHQARLGAILITHHHADHVGGIEALLTHAAHAHGIDDMPKVYGPAKEAIAGVNVHLSEGDEILLEFAASRLKVLEVPGHTSGHIAYVGDVSGEGPCVFCGDTLFAAGCGRLFEGTPEQMWASLQKLASLPETTRVFCTHEYTLSNLRFAVHALPSQPQIAKRLEQVIELRSRGEMTLPSTIGLEQRTNPFLLCASAAEFATMRKDKDHFRG